jgi:hypothetical protein
MFILVTLGWIISTTPASAQTRLVCFTEAGYKTVVDRVVNQMQFINNRLGQTADINYIRRQGCDYSNKPVADALLSDIYETDQGFIFPIFRARLGPTRQLMYVADGIFTSNEWVIDDCIRGNGECIEPRSCESLRGFLRASGSFLPNYMRVPRGCRP